MKAILVSAFLGCAVLAQAQLTPSLLYNAGPLPEAIAAGDLDGDGDQDLVVANRQGHLRLLINNGAGCFTQSLHRTYWTTTSDGIWPYLPNIGDVAIGDVNGDGRNDIVAVAAELNGLISVLINNGSLNFSAPVNYQACSFTKNLAIGDLNGDGFTDVASTSNCFQATVQINDHAGRFSILGHYGEGGYTSTRIRLGDIDGDRDLDAAFLNVGVSTVSVLRNDGAGALTWIANYATGDNPHDLAIADLDGDGDNDIATANYYSGNITPLVNNGLGSFTARPAISSGAGPDAIAAGDLDGDGRIDLAVGHRNGHDLAVLKGLGGGAFGAPQRHGAGFGPGGISVADFNRDGRLDVAVLSKLSEDAAVLLNTVNACPTPPNSPPNPIIVPLAGVPLSWGPNRVVHLTWLAARGQGVVIHRNGRRLMATENDGYHDDNVRGLAGPFRYQVCEQGYARSCSAEITVTF